MCKRSGAEHQAYADYEAADAQDTSPLQLTPKPAFILIAAAAPTVAAAA
jgi:hypothetical protein